MLGAVVQLPRYGGQPEALELAKGTCCDLMLNNDHGLDSAKVVEALLERVERQQLSGRGKAVQMQGI